MGGGNKELTAEAQEAREGKNRHSKAIEARPARRDKQERVKHDEARQGRQRETIEKERKGGK